MALKKSVPIYHFGIEHGLRRAPQSLLPHVDIAAIQQTMLNVHLRQGISGTQKAPGNGKKEEGWHDPGWTEQG